jgi:hypothetical protein
MVRDSADARSWAKAEDSSPQPRYRLTVDAQNDEDVWILLSQHLVSKDRALDDIALHVVEEHTSGATSHPQQLDLLVSPTHPTHGKP